MKFIVDIEWQEREHDSWEQVMAACMQSKPKHETGYLLRETVESTYDFKDHRNNYLPLNSKKMLEKISAGKRITLQWVKFDPNTNIACNCGTIFIQEKTASQKDAAETASSLQQLCNNLGFSAGTLGGQAFHPQEKTQALRNKMLTYEEIDRFCKEKNVFFHHVEQRQLPQNYLGNATHKPLQAVVYSSQYGMWSLAIFTDGTCMTCAEYHCQEIEAYTQLLLSLQKRLKVDESSNKE